jgi:hypothetical protein
LLDDLLEFGTVGAGVHKKSTTDRSWNSFGELQSGISLPGRLPYQLGNSEGRTDSDSDDFAFFPPFNLLELAR